MNNKLTINTLALGNLKRRRKQYTIMIIGIIFAMVLTSAVPLLFFSAAETRQRDRFNECGISDAIVYIPDKYTEFYDEAIRKDFIESYGFAHIIGYAYSADGEQTLGASVAWLDDSAKELSYQTFIEGGYPKNEGEIAIEKDALTKLGYKNAAIGDNISLRLDVQSGEKYYETVDKQYTLCGIASSKKNYITRYNYYEPGGYDTTVPALFVRQGTDTEVGGREKLTAYVVTNPSKDNDDGHYYYGGEPETFHDLANSLYFDEDSHSYREDSVYQYITLPTSKRVLTSPDALMYGGSMVVLVMLALIFAACVAIVNSFNNDLKGRKKQIGMLRAVGATRRQVFFVFGREALIISLFCVPVSILISYFAVKTILSIISEDNVMTKSLLILPVCAALNIAVVMAAAAVPLISASRITPVQAIRNIENNRKIKTKRIHSEKVFDPARHLARRDMTFYKGSRITVAVILSLTILVCCFGFSNLFYYMDHIYTQGYDYRLYNLTGYQSECYNHIGAPTGLSESERNEIASNPYLVETFGQKSVKAAITTGEVDDYMFTVLTAGRGLHDVFHDMEITEDNIQDKISKENFPEIKRITLENIRKDEYSSALREAFSTDDYLLEVQLISLDKSLIERLNEKTTDNINIDRLNSGEDVIIVAPEKVQWIIKTQIDKDGLGGGMTSYVATNTIIRKGDEKYVVSDLNCSCKAGDTLDLAIAEMEMNYDNGRYSYDIGRMENREVNVGAVVYTENLDIQVDDLMWSENSLFVVTTHEGMDRLYGGVNYSKIFANAYGDIDEQTDLQIMEDLQHYADKYGGWASSEYESRLSQIKQHRTDLLTLLTVIIIGFVVCASIINNALSAKIRESKAVIGTLRAVGASESELVRRYVWQMLTMFGIGAVIGYLLFVLIFFILKIRAYQLGYNPYPLYFSPWISFAMTTLLLVICGVNLWLRVREEMKHSIVENIREL